jgi:hypothetical protein
MAEIEIYTQPFCPYCARALKLLESKGVAFKEIDAPGRRCRRSSSTANTSADATIWWLSTGRAASMLCSVMPRAARHLDTTLKG